MLMRTFVGFYFVSKADDLLSEVLGQSTKCESSYKAVAIR